MTSEAAAPQPDRNALAKRSFMALFAFSARALQQVSTLVMTLLAAHFLLPSEYGIYSLGIVFVILIQTMTYTGFYQFILTSREEDTAVLSTCFWLIVGMVCVASAVLALLSYPLQWLFHAEELGNVLILLALIQPLASVGAWSSAALLRRRAITLNFTIMFFQNLMALLGGAILLWFWHSLYSLVAFRYLRVISGAVLFAVFGRDRPQMQFRKDLAITATAFSGGLYGSRILGFLSRYSADLLLGLLYSASAVGLYRFGNRVATAATDTLTQPMSNFAATQFGSAARKDSDLTAPLSRFSGTITLLTGMLGAVIVVFARDAISQLFHPSYIAALAVTYAMALRGVAGLGQLLIEPAFSARGRTHWVMMFNLVNATVSVLAVLCSSPWGLEVLAWTQVAVVFCSTLWAFALLHWKARIDVSRAIRNFAGALALCTTYGSLLYVLRHFVLAELSQNPLQVLSVGLSGATVLGLLMLMIGARMRLFDLKTFSG